MLAAAGGRQSSSAYAIHPPPQGLAQVTICTLSGMPANAWCPSRAREWAAGGVEAVPCAWHHHSGEGLLTIYPPEYRAWASSNRASDVVRRVSELGLLASDVGLRTWDVGLFVLLP